MAILQKEIINHLLTLIEKGQHGDMLPSQNELRRQFNVSTVTVRKALEKLEDIGCIYRHQGKGCFIRRPQPQALDTRVFLIISSKFSLDNEFISSLVIATQQTRYHTIFYHFDGNEDTMFYELNRFMPQIVIWLAPSIFSHEKILLKMLGMPLHLILFNRDYEHPSISYISGDFIGDGSRVGKALLQRNARKVVYLTLDKRMMFARKRGIGLAEEIESAGGELLQLDGKGLSDTADGEFGKMEVCLHSELVKLLKREKDIQALVCSQGQIWDDMLDAIREAGRVPEDFVLATFNRLPAHVPVENHMIVLVQPIAQMAADTVALAGRLLAGGKPEQLIYPSEALEKK